MDWDRSCRNVEYQNEAAWRPQLKIVPVEMLNSPMPEHYMTGMNKDSFEINLGFSVSNLGFSVSGPYPRW